MIVFLYGPDTYRAWRKLREIKTQYEKAHHYRVRAFDFDCREASLENVRSSMETASLFESKKLVVLRNVFQAPVFEQWLEQEKQGLSKSAHHVVVVFEQGDVQKKTGRKLFQWLKKNAATQEFLLLSAGKLQLWVERECVRYNVQIAPRAAEELCRAVGSDLWRMEQEIRKIAAWEKTADSAAVREAEVALLVPGQPEADIFATIDAAASKNKKQAFGLVYRHIQKGDATQYIFSMLQYQFRTLLEIRDAMDKGLSRQEMAGALKLHPYVLQKGIRVAERFSAAELKSIYERLFQLDWQQKTGRVDAAGSLDMFLATL